MSLEVYDGRMEIGSEVFIGVGTEYEELSLQRKILVKIGHDS